MWHVSFPLGVRRFRDGLALPDYARYRRGRRLALPARARRRQGQPDAGPSPTATPSYDAARRRDGGAARPGLGPRFQRLQPRPGSASRGVTRQRGVRPQRLQHPRRHPAPRPGRPAGAARDLLRAERRPARPVHRGDHRTSFAAPTLVRRADRPRGVAVRRLVQGRRGRGTTSAAATSPTTRAICWPSAGQVNFDKAFRDAASWLAAERGVPVCLRRPRSR